MDNLSAYETNCNQQYPSVLRTITGMNSRGPTGKLVLDLLDFVSKGVGRIVASPSHKASRFDIKRRVGWTKYHRVLLL